MSQKLSLLFAKIAGKHGGIPNCLRFEYLCEYNNIMTLSYRKILKIGTPEIITIIVLQLEQLDFTVQYCVQKMRTE